MRQQIEMVRTFVSEVNQEAKRVSWPLPREIAGATGVVLLATLLLSVTLFLYDMLISVALRFVLR